MKDLKQFLYFSLGCWWTDFRRNAFLLACVAQPAYVRHVVVTALSVIVERVSEFPLYFRSCLFVVVFPTKRLTRDIPHCRKHINMDLSTHGVIKKRTSGDMINLSLWIFFFFDCGSSVTPTVERKITKEILQHFRPSAKETLVKISVSAMDRCYRHSSLQERQNQDRSRQLLWKTDGKAHQ